MAQVPENESLGIRVDFSFYADRCCVLAECNGKAVQTTFGATDFPNIADSLVALFKGVFGGDEIRGLVEASLATATMFVALEEPTPLEELPLEVQEHIAELHAQAEESESSTESHEEGEATGEPSEPGEKTPSEGVVAVNDSENGQESGNEVL